MFVFYDTTRPKTFAHIKNWLEEIEVNRAATSTKANLVVAIIGSKADAPESEYQDADTVEIDVRALLRQVFDLFPFCCYLG